jgi:hypothetical protein
VGTAGQFLNFIILIKSMKRYSLVLILFTLVFGLTSCGKDNEKLTINDFKNDQILKTLTLEIKNFKKYFVKNDVNFIRESLQNISKESKKLITKYRENQINVYLDILIQEENNLSHQVSLRSCVRNSDDTVNDSDCSVWETIKYVVASAVKCPQPNANISLVDMEVYMEQVDDHLDCIQERICKNC